VCVVAISSISVRGTEQIAVSSTADARNLRVEAGPAGSVVITYDLVSSDAKVVVTAALQASRAPGGAFDIAPASVRGDVGPGLSPGSGKRIIWDAAKDVEDLQPELLQFRIRVATAPPLSATGERPDPSRATLTIVTVPEGVMLALDGRPLGLSPLVVRGVSAREHRITATKVGFESLNRLIKVEAGSADRIELVMTASTAASAQRTGASRGRWIAIGGGAAAAAGAAVALGGGGGSGGAATSTTPTPTTTPTTTTTTTPTTTTPNRAPTVTCGEVQFGTTRAMQQGDVGVISATRYRFSILSASDLDGDSLSALWTYGNGVTTTSTYSAANNSQTYVYPGAATYSPSVTVRDARTGEAGCRFSTVTTGSVAGEWVGPPTTGRISSRFQLSQSGLNVTGNYFEGERTAASALQGTLTTGVAGRKDGTMSITVGGNYANQLSFLLEPADDLRSYRGTYTYRGVSSSFEMRR